MPETRKVVITPGEPAGIGPDLVVQLAQRDWPVELVICADGALLTDRAKRLGLPLSLLPYDPAQPPVPQRAGTLTLLNVPLNVPAEPGVLNVQNGAYVVETLARACDGCLSGGSVAGFSLALEKYGTMPLNKVIRPAIKLAEEGFIVNDALADDLKTYGSEVIPQHENSKAIFWKNGEPLKKGDRLVQKNLGKSLELIAEHGPDAFYKGAIADQIADEMKKHGGLITKADLAGYKAVERTPVSGEYRGYEVYSMPPPSSGGIHIVQILNILENFDMQKYGFGSADAMQVMAEAEKHAYADRSEYLGDPDFVNVPWQALTSKAYAKAIAAEIDVNKAKPSSQIRPGKLAPYESNQTTHFSVVDKDGNAVAVTYTLNTTFGTGIVAGDSGILLNNQMDDFSAKPGVPNVYGLVGGDANAVEPKKRPLSSMSPTIVVKDGKTWLVTGSPGGSRIITTVLQMVVNTIDFGMNVAEATNAPRFHHQWLPDELRVEKGFSPDTLKLLEAKGQKVALKEAMGSTQSIMVGPDGMLYGTSDPRSPDDLTAGY